MEALWCDLYNLFAELPIDDMRWDRLFNDGDTLAVSTLPARGMPSGHTLAFVS